MRTTIALLLLFCALPLFAVKGNKDLVTVQITPDQYDWNYKVGQPAKFTVTLFKDQQKLKNATIKYAIGPEKMKPVQQNSLLLKEGETVLKADGMQQPGFLSCEVTTIVDGVTYRNIIGVAYECEKIKPTAKLPNDFKSFWDGQIEKMRKQPMTSQMTFMPELSTTEVNVYHVRLSHYASGCALYGMLCIPNKEGRFPAVLKVPGAGVTKRKGDIKLASMGVIVFEIGIHGIPMNLDDQVYPDLGSGALKNYTLNRLDDRDNYYFNRVYLGCIRANDYLVSLPQFDGKNLAVIGGSQGGALSIVTAALDSRVKNLVAYYPAMCDLTGYQNGRAGGWFGIRELTPTQINTLSYYDVVNFARYIKVPGFYSWGYSDETCPPTSYYSAYNLINAPKELYLLKEIGHWRYPEQDVKAHAWLVNSLTSSK